MGDWVLDHVVMTLTKIKQEGPWVGLNGGYMEVETRMENGIVGQVGEEKVEAVDDQLMNHRFGVEEGEVYHVAVRAKDARGAGIGKVGNFVIFIRNAKTRIGNIYKVKVTKVYRTFAYAELAEGGKQFIGNGSLLEL